MGKPAPVFKIIKKALKPISEEQPEALLRDSEDSRDSSDGSDDETIDLGNTSLGEVSFTISFD